jgi:hypothetical protein
MGNVVDMKLEVLASEPDEIKKIEAALQQPCGDLLEWVSRIWQEEPNDIAAGLKTLVTFTPAQAQSGSASNVRRLENCWKDRLWGVIWSHLSFVSRDFPDAIFFVTYWDNCMSYAGKSESRRT